MSHSSRPPQNLQSLPDATMPPSSPPAIPWIDPARQRAFAAWLATVAPTHHLDPASLRAASADASFRRYFRIDTVSGAAGAGSRIIMDAPPAQEDCQPFVTMARLLVAGGLHAPQVLAWDEAQGFMLLSDLGAVTYLSRLDPDAPAAAENKRLMVDALDALVRLQAIEARSHVPPYDRALLQREMDLFPAWYVERHRAVTLTEAQREVIQNAFELILENTLSQPSVLVHRDYHSRNLMVSQPNPGVLDFQDAVWGPITYDLASLLRDAYIAWDEEVQIDYAARYWERAKKAGLPVHPDFGEFWRDVEWMGLQRHLKVLGIFARLYHRDGKAGYLKDIPLVWAHAHRVCMRYRSLGRLAVLLEQVAGEERQLGYTF